MPVSIEMPDAARWLTAISSASSHDRIRMEWQQHGVALLPLGSFFEAVRIPAAVAQLTLSSGNWCVVADRLAEHLQGGPVIDDLRGRRYYALVPPGTAENWRAPAAQCLGEGTYLGVPRPDLTALDQRTLCSYWAVPMSRPGKLCRVSDVLTLVMVGGLLADEDDCEAPS